MAFQSQVAEIGIKVKINVVDLNIMLQKYTSGDYQLYSFGMTARPDPAMAYELFKRNRFWQEYPEIAKVIGEVNGTQDFEKRVKLFEKAHKIQMDGVGAINFYNYNYLFLRWPYLKGFKLTNIGFPLMWGVWLDK